ncbi:hypothetical protein BH09SUM1_BH09SUM1_24900 [soil metagenome]
MAVLPDYTIMKTTLLILQVTLIAAFIAAAATARAITFTAPERITDGTMRYQLARNSSRAIAFDSDDRLHLVYWVGGETTTALAPSYVYYRSWTNAGGWTAPQNIDDSFASATRLGGRHPSLIVKGDDSIFVTWHDHRHGSSPAAYNDNTEIYADQKSKTGSFSATDIRLTTSSSGNGGDNGYVPQPVLDANGRIIIAWYDFNANASTADIYLKTSDTAGAFNLADTMPQMRMTNLTDRSGAPSFSFPAITVTGDGARHLAWTSGSITGGALYCGDAAIGATFVTPTQLSTVAGDAFDPPHIAAAPDGTLWVLNADENGGANEKLTLRKRAAASSTFNAPIIIDPQTARQYGGAMAIGADGFIHLAWVDERAGAQVFYAKFNPANSQLSDEMAITSSGIWARPSIVLSSAGLPFVVLEEPTSLSNGDIWFVRPVSASAASTWDSYE